MEDREQEIYALRESKNSHYELFNTGTGAFKIREIKKEMEER